MSLGYLLFLIVAMLIGSVLVNVVSMAGYVKLGRHLLRRVSGEGLVIEPVAELPPGWEDRLETAASALPDLGFQWLGNFRTTATGETTWARVFFSADQRTFVTLNDTPKRSPYVFFSVFEDGAYLETNALASPTLASSTEDLLQLNALPNAPAAALWRAHVEAISERQILRGTEALAWAPEQYREVAAYVHRLLTWQQHGSDPTCRPDFSVATAGRECFVI